MKMFKLIVCSFIVCGYAMGASVTGLTGTVIDENGSPVVGAKLSLGKNPAKVESGADGTFNFGEIVSVRTPRAAGYMVNPVFTPDRVAFTVLQEKTPVRIDIFNLSGKKVRTVFNRTLAPKSYTVSLGYAKRASGAYIVKMSIGKRHFSHELVSSGNRLLQSAQAQGTSKGQAGTAAAEVAIDTIYCTLYGFENTKVGIPSYEAVVTINMTSVDTLPPVIKILGGDTVFVRLGDDDGRRKYWDATNLMIEVTDNITDSADIVITAPTQTLIDSSVSGFHLIEYKATDENNNSTSVNRMLVLVDSSVTDTDPPVITLEQDTINLTTGELFKDIGVLVTDVVDSHINYTNWIKRTGGILGDKAGTNSYYTNEAGVYTVTYEAMDTHNNIGSKVRTVIITDP